MVVKERLRHIAVELKGHAPFTALGALIGIAFMLIFKNISKPHANVLFGIFHPGHVVLSAMVTASLFSLHRKKKNIILILLVGYLGSVGIATLSDSIIPYFGESIFGLHIPTKSHTHNVEHNEIEQHDDTHENKHRIHIGFIEEWYIVNPAALLGILIAYFIPRTKFPHAGHVLISTWASSSHILMNMQSDMTLSIVFQIFIILFLAVWLPCCISDIVFPLIFVKSDIQVSVPCKVHGLHSHRHEEKGMGEDK